MDDSEMARSIGSRFTMADMVCANSRPNASAMSAGFMACTFPGWDCEVTEAFSKARSGKLGVYRETLTAYHSASGESRHETTYHNRRHYVYA
jgi:hypothetical protein